MLLPRVLTALVGVPLLLVLIHLGSWPFLLFNVGVVFLSLYEYGLMLRLGGRKIQLWATIIGGSLLALVMGLGHPAELSMFGGDLTGAVLAMILLLLMTREMASKEHLLERAALSLFGVIFIGWTLAHMALLRESRPYGERLTYLLFVTIWISDIAAYAVGKNIGRTKLAPRVSPGKTWEGAIAGFIAACLTVCLGRAWFMPAAFGPKAAIVLGLMLGIVGPLSDLAESVLKRAVGVKDSSSLLPGHGGVLDRFDAFLLTTPLMYYALLVFR